MMKKLICMLVLVFASLSMVNNALAAPATSSTEENTEFLRDYLKLVKLLNEDFTLMVTTFNGITDKASADKAAETLKQYADATDLNERMVLVAEIGRNKEALQAAVMEAASDSNLTQAEALELGKEGQKLVRLSSQFEPALNRVVQKDFFGSQALVEVLLEILNVEDEAE